MITELHMGRTTALAPVSVKARAQKKKSGEMQPSLGQAQPLHHLGENMGIGGALEAVAMRDPCASGEPRLHTV